KEETAYNQLVLSLTTGARRRERRPVAAGAKTRLQFFERNTWTEFQHTAHSSLNSGPLNLACSKAPQATSKKKTGRGKPSIPPTLPRNKVRRLLHLHHQTRIT